MASCILKKQVEGLIEKLTRMVVGPGVTEAARIRLAVAHVSVVQGSEKAWRPDAQCSKTWRNWNSTPPTWRGTRTADDIVAFSGLFSACMPVHTYPTSESCRSISETVAFIST